MDIYLTEIHNNQSRFVFPSLPQKIKVSRSARYQTYELISLGTVKIPNGSEVGTISWDGTFFGKGLKNSIPGSDWTPPKECKTVLERWRDNGAVLSLLITGSGICCNVTIQEFSYEETGGYRNYEYSITFAMHRDLKIYTMNELPIAPYAPEIEARPGLPEMTGLIAYTVAAGDSLWKVASKMLGDGNLWPKLYDANKKNLEAAARQQGQLSSDRGRLIYPGTQITVPKEG